MLNLYIGHEIYIVAGVSLSHLDWRLERGGLGAARVAVGVARRRHIVSHVGTRVRPRVREVQRDLRNPTPGGRKKHNLLSSFVFCGKKGSDDKC